MLVVVAHDGLGGAALAGLDGDTPLDVGLLVTPGAWSVVVVPILLVLEEFRGVALGGLDGGMP